MPVSTCCSWTFEHRARPRAWATTTSCGSEAATSSCCGALADSGADEALVTLLQRDQVAYGGYSAGACVLGPDLTELERVDDPTAVVAPVTTGLGLLDRPFVPHVRSPDHPESVLCDEVAAAYAARGQAHWALRDGEVLLVDGAAVEVLEP